MIPQNHNICLTWQGLNQNIPSTFLNAEYLAFQMFELSKNNFYSSSLKQYVDFCTQCFDKETSQDIFQCTFLYIIEDELCGFLNCRVIYGDVEIDYIFVKENLRRQMIGEKLLTYLICLLKSRLKYEKILLEVSDQNNPALTFYKKLGFQTHSIRKKYYKNGDNAAIMIYNLL